MHAVVTRPTVARLVVMRAVVTRAVVIRTVQSQPMCNAHHGHSLPSDNTTTPPITSAANTFCSRVLAY